MGGIGFGGKFFVFMTSWLWGDAMVLFIVRGSCIVGEVGRLYGGGGSERVTLSFFCGGEVFRTGCLFLNGSLCIASALGIVRLGSLSVKILDEVDRLLGVWSG